MPRWTTNPTVWFPLLLTVIAVGLTVYNPSIIDSYLETLLVDYQRAPLGLDLAIVILLGLFLSVAGSRLHAFQTGAFFGAAIIILVLANQVAFSVWGIRMNLLYPLGMVMTGGIFIISYRYSLEEKKAGKIKRIFSNSVTERVVNELIRNPDVARLGGERRKVTVLFCDIQGFTTFSEKHVPEQVVAMLNEFLEAMTEIVFKWEGTLDKFVGDQIVAFWGAPLVQENQVELAVRCALDMSRRMGQLRKKGEAENRTPLHLGIGINTGEVLVGNIGAQGKRMDYTVIGDNVNLGARVDALTREYHAQILITESVFRTIRDHVFSGNIGHCAVMGLEEVVVRGREEPVGLYEVRPLDHGSESIIEELE